MQRGLLQHFHFTRIVASDSYSGSSEAGSHLDPPGCYCTTNQTLIAFPIIFITGFFILSALLVSASVSQVLELVLMLETFVAADSESGIPRMHQPCL